MWCLCAALRVSCKGTSRDTSQCKNQTRVVNAPKQRHLLSLSHSRAWSERAPMLSRLLLSPLGAFVFSPPHALTMYFGADMKDHTLPRRWVNRPVRRCARRFVEIVSRMSSIR